MDDFQKIYELQEIETALCHMRTELDAECADYNMNYSLVQLIQEAEDQVKTGKTTIKELRYQDELLDDVYDAKDSLRASLPESRQEIKKLKTDLATICDLMFLTNADILPYLLNLERQRPDYKDCPEYQEQKQRDINFLSYLNGKNLKDRDLTTKVRLMTDYVSPYMGRVEGASETLTKCAKKEQDYKAYKSGIRARQQELKSFPDQMSISLQSDDIISHLLHYWDKNNLSDDDCADIKRIFFLHALDSASKYLTETAKRKKLTDIQQQGLDEFQMRTQFISKNSHLVPNYFNDAVLFFSAKIAEQSYDIQRGIIEEPVTSYLEDQIRWVRLDYFASKTSAPVIGACYLAFAPQISPKNTLAEIYKILPSNAQRTFYDMSTCTNDSLTRLDDDRFIDWVLIDRYLGNSNPNLEAFGRKYAETNIANRLKTLKKSLSDAKAEVKRMIDSPAYTQMLQMHDVIRPSSELLSFVHKQNEARKKDNEIPNGLFMTKSFITQMHRCFGPEQRS